MPSRLTVLALSFLLSCGCEYSRSAQQEDAGMHPANTAQQSALPSCLTSGALINSPATEVQRCAGAPCSVTPAGVSGSASEVWRYCGGTCSSTCQDVATVHIINGRVMGIGTNDAQYRP